MARCSNVSLSLRSLFLSLFFLLLCLSWRSLISLRGPIFSFFSSPTQNQSKKAACKNARKYIHDCVAHKHTLAPLETHTTQTHKHKIAVHFWCFGIRIAARCARSNWFPCNFDGNLRAHECPLQIHSQWGYWFFPPNCSAHNLCVTLPQSSPIDRPGSKANANAHINTQQVQWNDVFVLSGAHWCRLCVPYCCNCQSRAQICHCKWWLLQNVVVVNTHTHTHRNNQWDRFNEPTAFIAPTFGQRRCHAHPNNSHAQTLERSPLINEYKRQ